MENIKNYLARQWAPFYQTWASYFDGLRLDLAVVLANYKYRASKKKHTYYVLPDQDDKLLVLSPEDIERLKSIGEIKYRALTKAKAVYRKKNGIKRFKKMKVRIIGRKAFGISMMNHKVTLGDVDRECFYRSPMNGEQLSMQVREGKRTEWIIYAREMRKRKVAKSAKQ